MLLVWFLKVLTAQNQVAAFCAIILKFVLLVHEINEPTNDWLVIQIVNKRMNDAINQ